MNMLYKHPQSRYLLARGFTLVELMVTIAILGILTAVAVPSYQALIINSRMTTQASEFLTALEFTRSEAVKRNTRATMCRSSNGATCATTADGNWQPGWIVFVDGGNVGTIDAADTILKVHGALTGGSTLSAATNAAPPVSVDFVSYASNGQVTPIMVAPVTFSLCSINTALAGRNIVIAAGSSRVNVANAACS